MSDFSTPGRHDGVKHKDTTCSLTLLSFLKYDIHGACDIGLQGT